MDKHFDIEEHLRDHSDLPAPSPDFTKKVMGAIAGTRIAPPAKTYINKRIVYGIGTFFILMITGFLIYACASVNWSEKGSFTLPVDLSRLDYSKYFGRQTLNYLLPLNALLALVFLDKYLVRKRAHRSLTPE